MHESALHFILTYMKLTDKDLKNMAKIELHRHLDGSVRFETIRDIADRHNIDLGTEVPEVLFKRVKILKPMENLEAALAVFKTMQKVLCSYDALKQITYENVEDAYWDGCHLVELRFSPAYIAAGKNIGYDEIIEGVIDGISAGMDEYAVQVGLIGIASRGYPEEANKQALEELIRYKKAYYKNSDRIWGFDLADGESEDTIRNYISMVSRAREAGLGITVHTGENTGPELVRASIEAYSPDRIGHGIQAAGDRKTEEAIKAADIHLEVCPTSNMLTRSVPSLPEHPLPRLYKKGISVSINSDDPQLMNIDLIYEYKICRDIFGFGPEEFIRCRNEGRRSSFADDEIKKYVEKSIQNCLL